jgi:hypothetical protein
MRNERKTTVVLVWALVAAFGLLASPDALQAAPPVNFGTFSSHYGTVKLSDVTNATLGCRLIWGHLEKHNGNVVRLYGTVSDSGHLILVVCGEHDNGVAELAPDGQDYVGSIRFHSGWKVRWKLERT